PVDRPRHGWGSEGSVGCAAIEAAFEGARRQARQEVARGRRRLWARLASGDDEQSAAQGAVPKALPADEATSLMIRGRDASLACYLIGRHGRLAYPQTGLYGIGRTVKPPATAGAAGRRRAGRAPLRR